MANRHTKGDLSFDEKQEILRLRAKNMSLREIAERTGRSFGAVQKTVASGGSVPCDVLPNIKGAPDEDEVDVVVDETEIDGSVRVVKRGQTLIHPDKLAAMAGLDPLTWVVKGFRTGTYEQMYKLKNYLPDRLIKKLVRVVEQGGGFEQVKTEINSAEYGHRKVQLTTNRAYFEHLMHEDVESTWRRWVEKHGGKPLPKQQWRHPKDSDRWIWVNYGYYDTHVGMYAYAKEVGANYDVGIAVTRVLNSIDEMIDRLKRLAKVEGPIHTVFVPVGNDLGHFDNVKMTTALGDHRLDVDTRFTWVFDGALTCMAYQVERLCEVAKHVRILYVPGNHDTSMSYGICRSMQQRFARWPQVSADLDMNPRKYETFGSCILGFDHGQCKPEKWATTFVAENQGKWDGCTYAEINNGHTHQARQLIIPMSTPSNSIYVRVHPSLCPPDSWHHKNQFIGSPLRSVEALYYDDRGRIGDLVVYADDTRERDVDLTIKEVLGGTYDFKRAGGSPA